MDLITTKVKGILYAKDPSTGKWRILDVQCRGCEGIFNPTDQGALPNICADCVEDSGRSSVGCEFNSLEQVARAQQIGREEVRHQQWMLATHGVKII